jgi:hypothetical protein
MLRACAKRERVMGRRGFRSLALLCLILAGAARPALAQDYFGAIAYSPTTRAHGWAYDYTSRSEAQSRAMDECRRHADDCVVALWFRNACGALAAGVDGYGASWGTNRGLAERSAMESCRRHAGDCAIKRWICTTRQEAKKESQSR